jgi:CubicO group peptidase (beta-lactamase class C family)
MTFPAFGALNASVADMARLLTMLLEAGRHDGEQLFSLASIRSLFAAGSSLGARAGLEVGYGTGMYSWISNGHQFWGHGGDADGYRSRYGLLPDTGRGYLIAINTDRPALLGRIVRRLERALSQDLPARPARQPAITEDAGFSRLTGTYYPSTARFDVTGWLAGEAATAEVRRLDDGLEFVRGERRTKLIPMGPGQFRRPDDPVVTVVFAADEHGSLFLQGELGNYVNTSLCPGFLLDCHQ